MSQDYLEYCQPRTARRNTFAFDGDFYLCDLVRAIEHDPTGVTIWYGERRIHKLVPSPQSPRKVAVSIAHMVGWLSATEADQMIALIDD